MNKLKTFLWVFLGLFALVAVGAFAVQASPINTTSNNEATTPDEPVDIVEYTTYDFLFENTTLCSLAVEENGSFVSVVTPNGIDNYQFEVGTVYQIFIDPNTNFHLTSVSHNNDILFSGSDLNSRFFEFTAVKDGTFVATASRYYTIYNFNLENVSVANLRESNNSGGFTDVWDYSGAYCDISEFNFIIGAIYMVGLCPADGLCITNVSHNDETLFSGVETACNWFNFTAVENGTLTATAGVVYTNYTLNNTNTDYELYYYDNNTGTQNLVDLSAGIENYQFLVGGHYKFVFTPYSGFCVSEVVHNLEILHQGAYSNGAYEVEFVAVNNGAFYVTSSVFTQIYSIEINNGNYELYAWDGTSSYNPIDLSQGLENYQFTVGGTYKLVVTPYTGFNNVTVNHGGEILFDSVPVDSTLEIEFKAKLNGMFQIDCFIV